MADLNDTAPPSISGLMAELEETRQALDLANALAESYRLSAKARAEEITGLLQVAPKPSAANVNKELRRLRELESRRSVRVVVRVLRPIEKPYQAAKRTVRRVIVRSKRA